MKFKVTAPIEIDVKKIRIFVPVKYGEDDMPNDFPFRIGDSWAVTIDVEEGKILDWPEGIAHKLEMKVTDGGSYYLLGGANDVLASLEQDYVPDCIPGSYGDYIDLDIAEDGTIMNWDKNFGIEEFFPNDE
jgi:hypothetical protein